MKSFLTKLIFPAAIVLTVFSSCRDEKGCTNPKAMNYSQTAETDDGSCTFYRDQFIGSYTMQLTCVYEDDATFDMDIVKGPDDDQIILQNFYNYNVNVVAQVTGNVLSFNDEEAGVHFEGEGYFVNNELSISFQVCEAFYYPCSDPDYCNQIGPKK